MIYCTALVVGTTGSDSDDLNCLTNRYSSSVSQLTASRRSLPVGKDQRQLESKYTYGPCLSIVPAPCANDQIRRASGNHPSRCAASSSLWQKLNKNALRRPTLR